MWIVVTAAAAVIVLAAVLAAVYWARRRKRTKSALLAHQQQQQQEEEQGKLTAQMEEGSGMVYATDGSSYGRPSSGFRGPPGWRHKQLAPHGPGVPAGLLGRSLDM